MNNARIAEPTKPVVAPTSPLDPEMERKREALRRVQVLTDQMALRGSEILNQNPDFVYIWIFNHPQRIDVFRGMDAELVTRETDPKVETSFKRSDGTHVRGDTILMRMRREIAEAWNHQRDWRAAKAKDGAVAQFEEFAMREGLPLRSKGRG